MVKRNLWLDDLRPAPNGWLWAKTYKEAIELLKVYDHDEIEFASLDHDLGWCEVCTDTHSMLVLDECKCTCHKTGYDVIKWMEENNRWPLQRPNVHSMNPVARRNMEAAIDRKYNRRDE